MEEKNLKKEIGARFRQIREHFDYSQVEIARILDIKQSTISQIEAGANFPGVGILSLLVEKFDVNLSWLIGGKGTMLTHHNEIQALLGSGDKLDKRYIDLLKFMQANPDAEQVILNKMTELRYIEKVAARLAKQ